MCLNPKVTSGNLDHPYFVNNLTMLFVVSSSGAANQAGQSDHSPDATGLRPRNHTVQNHLCGHGWLPVHRGCCWLVECCFTSTETVRLLGTGTQDGHLDFHTGPELWVVPFDRFYSTHCARM